MRLAIISDIHGNLLALQAVLADIARQGVDQTVNLGDILSGPLQVAATADLLMGLGLTTIAGNHERQLLQVWDGPAAKIDPLTSDGYAATQTGAHCAAWIRALPPKHWLTPDVLLVHGTPGDDLVYWLETVMPDYGQHGSSGVRAATPDEVQERLGNEADVAQASLILCGHTHVPRMVQSAHVLIVNPGSVGLQAYDDDHPYPNVIENGAPHARYALLEKNRQGWQVDLRAVPYDHMAQARLAAQHHRPDWAHALATGFMKRAA